MNLGVSMLQYFVEYFDKDNSAIHGGIVITGQYFFSYLLEYKKDFLVGEIFFNKKSTYSIQTLTVA